ncbi:hypothetical protein ACWGLE_20620 [Streptomyces sp. NPDC055897]
MIGDCAADGDQLAVGRVGAGWAVAGADALARLVVLTRATKGGFNPLAHAGLREITPVLVDLLGPSSRLAAAGAGQRAVVGRMLQRAAAGQPTAQAALPPAVSAEVWLRQLETASAWWEVNSV